MNDQIIRLTVSTEPITLAKRKGKPRQFRIPTLRTGTFHHPFWGQLSFDEHVFRRMIANFENDVLGHDLALNIAHKSEWGALAWITSLEIDDDKLIAFARPTPKGLQLVPRQYRYGSAEWSRKFQDVETGEQFGETLRGIGATNVPFIPRLNGIQRLSRDSKMGTQWLMFTESDGTVRLIAEKRKAEGRQLSLDEAEAAAKEHERRGLGLVSAAPSEEVRLQQLRRRQLEADRRAAEQELEDLQALVRRAEELASWGGKGPSAALVRAVDSASLRLQDYNETLVTGEPQSLQDWERWAKRRRRQLASFRGEPVALET